MTMTDFNEAVTPPPPPPGVPGAEERQWAMFAHLSALVGGILTSGWAGSIGCFIGPLIIWLLKKDAMPFVDDQAKEALNFKITVVIAFFALFLLALFTFGIGLVVAVPLWIIIGVAWLVFTIIAAIKANEGVAYRYPFTLRLVREAAAVRAAAMWERPRPRSGKLPMHGRQSGASPHAHGRGAACPFPRDCPRA
jgi:uncharacterized Tic20 family protein